MDLDLNELFILYEATGNQNYLDRYKDTVKEIYEAVVTPTSPVYGTDNNRNPNKDDRRPKVYDQEDREWIKKQKEENDGKSFQEKLLSHWKK